MRCELITSGLLLIGLSGCMSAPQHRADVRDASADNLTVGKVQKDIRVGMSGAEVMRLLGAPNIVTSGADHGETWVYDRVATESVYSTSEGGVSGLVIGAVDAVGGGAGGHASRSAGATSRTQRTLTIVLGMDADGRVHDIAYRASQF